MPPYLSAETDNVGSRKQAILADLRSTSLALAVILYTPCYSRPVKFRDFSAWGFFSLTFMVVKLFTVDGGESND